MPYKDPAKRAAIKRRWHERHPTWRADWKHANPDYDFKRKYGITRDQYQQIADAQHGKCAICHKRPRQLVVDHDHKTGRVRGLLCNGCNSGLGFFADDLLRLRRARNYLLGKRPQIPT